MRGRNRAHVKARIRDITRDFVFADEDVTVSYSLDSQPVTNAVFLILGCTGANELEDLTATLFTDRFVVKARVESHGHDDAETAEIEAERLLRLFEVRISASKNLTHPEVPYDTDDGGYPPFDGVQTPFLGEIDGPQSGMPQTGASIVGWVDFEIECRCNVQRST